ncbi:ABC transporter permease [Nigerium massiliense]|uniref:ABC transporter permease n=1 Tax=Nigerium massiliense TaxID=1522317 RepID=UPI00058DB5F8|nr:ABC transporter permease [Nigerium massiliense]
MASSVARRLGVFVLSLLAASVVIFLIAQALPGDVARIMLGNEASQADVDALRAQLGLDRPLPVRYLEWMGGLLHGDAGTSYLSGAPVSELIAPRLGVTLWLTGLALVLAVLVAVPLGMVAALHRRDAGGFVVSAVAQVGMAVPAFVAGIVLVAVFSVRLHLLPATGYVPLRSDPLGWARSLVLPVVALAAVQASVLTRYVRSAFIDVLTEDYYRTARAVGWTRGLAMLRHGLRNASLSLVTVLGLQLASVLVGAIVIEQVFVLPGLGQLLLEAVAQKDVLVVQGIVMLLVVFVLLINALVEVAAVALDPRVGEEVA